MPMTYSKCGDWWAARLLPIYAEKRDAFARAVVAGIVRFIEQYPDHNVFRIRVDYDPDQLLLDALHEAGIPCRGFLCSADRVFDDCWKTEMRIDLRAETVKVSL